MTTVNGSSATQADLQNRDRSRLLTWHDAVQRLLDTQDFISEGTRQVRLAKRATVEALEQMVAYNKKWSHYTDILRTTFPAAFSTGTVDYDESAGTVTLSTGTWPSWTYHADIRIGERDYAVQSFSSTVIQLGDSKPPADLTGSAFKLYARRMPIPYRVRALGEIFTNPDRYRAEAMTIDELLEEENRYGPYAVTVNGTFSHTTNSYGLAVSGDQRFPGQSVLHIYPPPEALLNITSAIKRYPCELNIYSESTGTVALVGTTLTITGGTFSTDAVGGVIRIAPSGAAGPPSSYLGDVTDTEDSDVIGWDYEFVVKSRTSSTVVEVEGDGTEMSDFSGRNFRLSSMVDVAPGPMTNAYHACCELALAEQMGQDSKILNRRQVVFDRKLEEAMFADSSVEGRKNATQEFTLGYLAGG